MVLKGPKKKQYRKLQPKSEFKQHQEDKEQVVHHKRTEKNTHKTNSMNHQTKGKFRYN